MRRWILVMLLMALALGASGCHHSMSEKSVGTSPASGRDATQKEWEDPIEDAYDRAARKMEGERALEEAQKKLEEKRKKREGFTLFAAGDVMFHEPQIPAAKTPAGYDFWPTFRAIAPMLKDQHAIVNFESTIAEDRFSGYPMFRTPIEGIEAVKKAGFDIVGLANNHAVDGGKEGVERTLKAARTLGLTAIGTFDRKPETITYASFGERKVALLCYTYGVNGLDARLGEDQWMVARIDPERIHQDITEAKAHADGVIVLIHWGTEYRREPTDAQVQLAHEMAEWGADVILGSHPHVIEPAEWIETDRGSTYCIYSMGNFVSNQRREYMGQPYSEDGLIVELSIEGRSDGLQVVGVKYHPTWVRKRKAEGTTLYEILPAEPALRHLVPALDAATEARLEESYRRTMEHLEAGGR